MSLLHEEATASYRALLPRHLESTRAAIAGSAAAVTFLGRPICTSLEPLFLDRAAYEKGLRDSMLVLEGLGRTARAISHRYSPRHRELLDLAAGRPGVLLARMDALPVGDQLSFIELNAVGPSGATPGFAHLDPLNAVFAGLPLMEELREQGFVAESVDHFRALAETIMDAHHDRGGTGAPRIAVIEVPKIADDNQLTEIVASDNELMPAIGYLLERGCELRLCDVSAVQLSGNRLVIEDFVVDYVFLADETDRYLETCPPDAPLLVALKHGTVALADGPPLGLLFNDKALFADLSERASGLVLPEDVQDAVDRSVPWTRRCREGRSTYGGRDVNLVPFILENREKLVLKPANSYAGKNVHLGWEVAPEAWASAVTGALGTQNFIVQERVVGDRTRVSLLDGDAASAKDVYFDVNPLIWGGRRAAGALVRISTAALLNVSAGTGSATGVFVVGDRA